MNDMVSLFDRKFSGKNAVPCPNNGVRTTLPQSKVSSEEHGNMVVHGSGSYLVCGLCGAKQPIGSL